MKIKFKYLSTCSLLVAASASAATLTIPVAQDGWIGAGAEATLAQDFGIGFQLNVATPDPAGAWQYTRKAWFGFDTSALAALGNVNICSATLTVNTGPNISSSYNGNNAVRFYGVTNENPGSIDGLALEDKFDETLLTWDNAPGNLAGNVLTADRVNGTILADVPVPNPAAGGVMTFTGYGNSTLVEFLKQQNTNNFVAIAATYLGQNNTGFGAYTGLSFRSKEDTGFGAVLTIEYTSDPCPVIITSQPQLTPTGTIYNGQPFSLSVEAVGTPDLYYQWRKDGLEVSGATDATYAKASSLVSDSGVYQVVITNAANAVTSSPVTVTITPLFFPEITKAPVSQSFFSGYPATFSVEAIGGDLSYQWKKGTTAIPDATNTSYTISSISTGDADTYTVEVSNPIGMASASATLEVVIPTPGTLEEAVAATKPLVWLRYSDTTAPVQDVAANSGSLGSTGNGLYIGANSHPVAGGLAGSTDTAASFAGGRVSVPYSASLNTAAFTIEAWLKPAVALTGTTLTSPLSSANIANPRSGWLIYQSSTGWNFRTYNQSGTDTAVNVTAGPAPVANEWYHVVASWDGTVGRVYINGVLTSTSTPTNFVQNPDRAFTVGARSDGAFAWSGSADEVALYATALSDAQILAHYQNGTNAARSTPYESLIAADGPVEYLRLNEPAYGGKPANFGTLGASWNGAYVDAGGVLGSPLIGVGEAGPLPPTYPGFESTNRAVSLTNGYSRVPRVDLGNNVTVTTWIKRQNPSTTGDLSWPAWLGDGGLHLNQGTLANPQAELRYHWKGGQWGWSSGLFVPADEWTFVAMVIQPNAATFYMSSGTNLLVSARSVTHAPLATTSPVTFGGGQPGRADRNFIGQLDESTVYNRALSQSEINTLFILGTGAKLDLSLVPGGGIKDTKPAGTPHNGLNFGSSWLASSTDFMNVTRDGVQLFETAKPSQIVVPADPDFDSPSGTITFWMRANAPIPGPGSEAAILFDRRTSTGTIIGLDDAGSIYWQGQAGSRNTLTAGYLPDYNWHHVAVTYGQTTSDNISIYVDGILAAFTPVTNAWSWPTDQQIEIGRSHDGYWKRYDGELDDFRIYNRVLTDTEIGQLYSTGALVDTAALKLRFNFDDMGFGNSVVWPFGTLQSSPVLGPDANWTPVPGATSPYPFLPTQPSLFFRAVP